MMHLFSIFCPIIFFSIACIGAGAGVLRLFSQKYQETALTEVVLAFILGQGILGSLFLIPALMHQFSKPVVLCITVPIACLGLCHLFGTRKTFLIAVEAFNQAFIKATLLWKIVALGVTCIVILAGSSAIAGIITVDAKAFYLVLPKVVASSHRLVSLPSYESFMSIGLIAEMQLAVLFLLGMPGATARLFCWLTGVAGAAILIAICRHSGLSKRGQLISIAIMVTSTAVTLLWGQGKTEIFAAVFGLCGALYALGSWDATTRKDSIILAGIFTGFALVAKLTYIVAFLPAIYILVFWKEIPNLWLALYAGGNRLFIIRQHVTECLLFGAAVFITFIPHLAKNLILIGTIISTYGDGQWFSAETTQHLVLTYPLMLIFGNYWAQYGNMSPLLLSFLPLVLLTPWPKKPWNSHVSAILIASLVGLVAWVILFPAIPMLRYFLATLLLLVVPAAWAAERCSRQDKVLEYAIVITMIIVLIVFRWSSPTLSFVPDAFKYLFVNQSEHALNSEEAFSYQVYEAINQEAKPGSRVFLISYFRFWLRPDLIQTSNGVHDLNIIWDEKYPDKFWLKLYENGFTYLYAENSTNPIMRALKYVPDWVTIESIYQKKNYGAAYRLTYKNAPSKVRLITKEVSSGAWEVVPSN